VSTTITLAGAKSVTFSITITGTGVMTNITGTVPLDNNTTIAAPGAVTPTATMSLLVPSGKMSMMGLKKVSIL